MTEPLSPRNLLDAEPPDRSRFGRTVAAGVKLLWELPERRRRRHIRDAKAALNRAIDRIEIRQMVRSLFPRTAR